MRFSFALAIVTFSVVSLGGVALASGSTTPGKTAPGKTTPKKGKVMTTETPAKPAHTTGTHLVLTTNMGVIKIELDAEKAPITVKNFVSYVESGHFNKTIFHRVIDGFMIQGGGFDEKMKEKPTKAPIVLEAKNGLKNDKGTLAMARTSDPNSATAQFFINLINNDFLNATPNNPGYAVFGKVTEGMDVVEKIGKVKTATFGPYGDVPKSPVIIESIVLEK